MNLFYVLSFSRYRSAFLSHIPFKHTIIEKHYNRKIGVISRTKVPFLFFYLWSRFRASHIQTGAQRNASFSHWISYVCHFSSLVPSLPFREQFILENLIYFPTQKLPPSLSLPDIFIQPSVGTRACRTFTQWFFLLLTK